MDGGVAQLGERLPCTQEVIGSIPFTSTIIRSQKSEARGQKKMFSTLLLVEGFWPGVRIDGWVKCLVLIQPSGRHA